MGKYMHSDLSGDKVRMLYDKEGALIQCQRKGDASVITVIASRQQLRDMRAWITSRLADGPVLDGIDPNNVMMTGPIPAPQFIGGPEVRLHVLAPDGVDWSVSWPIGTEPSPAQMADMINAAAPMSEALDAQDSEAPAPSPVCTRAHLPEATDLRIQVGEVRKRLRRALDIPDHIESGSTVDMIQNLIFERDALAQKHATSVEIQLHMGAENRRTATELSKINSTLIMAGIQAGVAGVEELVSKARLDAAALLDRDRRITDLEATNAMLAGRSDLLSQLDSHIGNATGGTTGREGVSLLVHNKKLALRNAADARNEASQLRQNLRDAAQVLRNLVASYEAEELHIPDHRITMISSARTVLSDSEVQKLR